MLASVQYPLEQVVTHASLHELAKLRQDFLGDLSGRLFGAGRLFAYSSLAKQPIFPALPDMDPPSWRVLCV